MFVHSPEKKSCSFNEDVFFHKGFVAMGPTSKIVGPIGLLTVVLQTIHVDATVSLTKHRRQKACG